VTPLMKHDKDGSIYFSAGATLTLGSTMPKRTQKLLRALKPTGLAILAVSYLTIVLAIPGLFPYDPDRFRVFLERRRVLNQEPPLLKPSKQAS
jgi:hypothetical protein